LTLFFKERSRNTEKIFHAKFKTLKVNHM
jgi:hypothetical protein